MFFEDRFSKYFEKVLVLQGKPKNRLEYSFEKKTVVYF